MNVERGEFHEAVEGVRLAQDAATASMSVQRFRIDAGATVPEHAHPHEQVGVVHEGELVFLVDGEEHPAGPGDTYAVPGGEPHRVENRGDVCAVGVDIFSPPRTDPGWLD